MDHKLLYRTYEMAAGAAHRLPTPGHVYWCVKGGGYHVSRLDATDYARARARPIEEEPMPRIDLRLEIDTTDFDRNSGTGLTQKAYDRLEWAIRSAGFEIDDGPKLVPPQGGLGDHSDTVSP